jgi:hypothetical protein
MPLIIHARPPAGWAAGLNIHYWDTSPAEPATIWPGLAMTDDGNGWFSHAFATAEAASLIFNDGAGRQTGNLRRDRSGWYDGATGQWSDENPDRPRIPVIRATPHARIYTAPQQVTLESTNPDDAIHYTLDGSMPTAASARYIAPLLIAASTVLSAVGIDPSSV